jgi:ABC-type antimicrobial peptide transport system permease subunit
MKTQWAEVFPNRIYSGEYLNDEMEEARDVNINIVKMFIFLGLVATFLSALGLYSLVSLNIMKRMKEIGIRKVLGAKIGNIALVVNKQFLIIMLVASVLGSVAGYYMTTGLMQQIWAYYINLGADAFILSLAVLFSVSVLTVGYKIYAAANVNPAYTLRNE